MRKSTMFISTVLTISMMVLLVGVVSAYKQISAPAPVNTPAPVQPAQEVAVIPPAPDQPTIITPEQATTIAVDYLGDTNVYSVETVDYNGSTAYLVTFSSGKLVYVSLTGDILEVSEIQPVTVVTNNNNKNSNEAPQTISNTGNNHEDHDEHDDHEDHEEDD